MSLSGVQIPYSAGYTLPFDLKKSSQSWLYFERKLLVPHNLAVVGI
jgi:hypothetical protein